MPSSVVASKLASQSPALGRTVYETLIERLPWDNITDGMTPGFLQRVMFLPSPSRPGELLLDESGSPVLSKVGQYIWQNSKEPMEAVEMARDFTGQHVKKLEQDYFAKQGISPPPQSIPTSQIADVIEKEQAPYGSLEIPLKMRENNPHGNPPPGVEEELNLSLKPSARHGDFSITNPFIYGPLAAASGIGGLSLMGMGQDEEGEVPLRKY